MEKLLAAFDDSADAAGVVPELVDKAGQSLCRWQLRPLPSAVELVLQTFLLPTVTGPRREPGRGRAIVQPAGALSGWRPPREIAELFSPERR